jgi:uncharacterized protein YggU (UPF0235/DUF167 family)
MKKLSVKVKPNSKQQRIEIGENGFVSNLPLSMGKPMQN